MEESVIKGNLIIGGLATGKTTELVNLTESLLRYNPDWHLLAIAGHAYSEKLVSSLKYDVRHEIFTCEQVDEWGTQEGFVDRLEEICFQSDFKALIVVDESLLFFSDHETRRRFVDLIIEANADSESSKRIYTLIAAQSFYDFGGLYSTELAANFTEYTLLRTPASESFFSLQGIDTAQIDKGVKYSMLRSLPLRPSPNTRDKFLISSEQIKFPATVDYHGNSFRAASKLWHFSLLVLPLLVTSFFYYYNAPSLNWIGVGNGEHLFSQKIFELTFVLRALVTAAYYLFAFFLLIYSVNKTIILINSDDEDPVSYFQKELGISVLLTLLFSSALIFLNAVLSIVIEVPPYYPVGIK